MNDLLKQLQGDDRRSIGASPRVVSQVMTDPGLFPLVFAGMTDPDPLVRMRSADAVEKITAGHPEYLTPYRGQRIKLAGTAEQREVRQAPCATAVARRAKKKRNAVRS
jgi:hypothetical protein